MTQADQKYRVRYKFIFINNSYLNYETPYNGPYIKLHQLLKWHSDHINGVDDRSSHNLYPKTTKCVEFYWNQ